MTKNKKTLIRVAVSATICIVAVVLKYTVNLNDWWQLGMFVAAYLVSAYDVLWGAIRNVTKGKLFDEKFLMTIATIGAFVIEEYFDAVAVMVFYQIGEVFQRYAVGKSRKSIASLVEIRPEVATVLRNGEATNVHPSEIAIGEIILIKPGDKIPLDGIIIEGNCSLNTAAITGESLPQNVSNGDKVISGCINLDGVIKVQTTTTYEDSTVSKILDLVQNATANKAPAEKFITKFSRYYTPIVAALALLLGVVPPIFDGLWTVWLKRAMMFLFVSCPCALVISVPLGFFGGIAAASKQGILVKGSNYLELLNKTNVVALDKTGTLTKGNFVVTQVYPEEMRDKILQAACIAEQHSNHPIAKSICQGQKPQSNAQITEIAGKGVIATTDTNTILCGNQLLMQQYGIRCLTPNSAGTVVHLATNNQYLGYIVVADQLKEDAPSAIKQLKQMGCTTVMLTGDNHTTAQQIGNLLQMDAVHSQLLPQDKTAILQQLQQPKGSVVAFAGDGINDAPVLATADVGIAMGAMGSDVAIETADVVLMQDNPTAIATAKRIAKRTMRIVTQNIVFSIAVKVAVLVLSAIGVLDKTQFGMVIAILADVGVCIVAILNSMRALRSKNKNKNAPNHPSGTSDHPA